MGTRDPRVDDYIARSAEFARPILTHLREVVHAACPDVAETIKWGFPHFMHQGILCSTAAFKEHCALNFWKGALVIGHGADGDSEEAMGQFGRITMLADLPSAQVLSGYVRKAMALNESGTKAPARKKASPKPALAVPDDLAGALRKSRKAAATFEAFSPSQRREYIEWITEAKGEGTRARRLATTIEWLAEGKPRNWKYMRGR
ncbi:MAG TPA: YdeI/OmpD-associated family protein [Gemmatimonadaceae bacterium]|nr:YdeI/OmpD-associated family protein [Gemmatimonadaceae bacterium]